MIHGDSLNTGLTEIDLSGDQWSCPVVTSASAFYLGAHGSNGNFSFLDGHATAIHSPGHFANVFRSEYTTTTITVTVYDSNRVRVAR